MPQLNRRRFLKNSIVAGAAAAATFAGEKVVKAASSERVRVGVVGAGGQAGYLNRLFAENKYAEVVGIADIDSRRLPRAVEEAQERQGKKPWTTGDFRKLIDDPSIDALVVGTPDHWHAIPSIMACIAGKDVYVEKPDAHNIIEGRRIVAAMRKHKRIVQMGSQHRSTRRLQSAIEYVRTGALGRCLMAKAWESSRQGSIGYPPDEEVPDGVDYDMWLGSAPSGRLTATASTASGAGSMTTVRATWAMTEYTGSIWPMQRSTPPAKRRATNRSACRRPSAPAAASGTSMTCRSGRTRW